MTQLRAAGEYWREIVAVLALKAMGLALLYGLFFAPGDRPAITPETVAEHFEQGDQP